MKETDFPVAGLVAALVVFWLVSDPNRLHTLKPRAYLLTARGLQQAARILGQVGIAAERAYHTAMEASKI